MSEASLERARAIEAHYARVWAPPDAVLRASRGPVHELPPGFAVLSIPRAKGMRAYATCCMSASEDEVGLELFMLAREGDRAVADASILELLAAVAHYHRTGPMGIRRGGRRLQPGAERFLRFVVEYVRTSGRSIRPGETLRYGYWLVKFVADTSDPDALEVTEYDAEATAFHPGGTLAIRYWEDQHRVCARHSAVFAPPDRTRSRRCPWASRKGSRRRGCDIRGRPTCPGGSS